MNDCCYVCEMKVEGLEVPHPVNAGQWILVCTDCVLSAIYAIPRLAAFSEFAKENQVVN